jgi:hypothetical protein
MKTAMAEEWRLGQTLSNHQEDWRRQASPLWYGLDGNSGFSLEDLEIEEENLLHASH